MRSSSLILAAGSASSRPGADNLGRNELYRAGVWFGQSSSLTSRDYNLVIGFIDPNFGFIPVARQQPQSGQLWQFSSERSRPSLYGYTNSGSQTAYWQWAIDRNWTPRKR